jgi:hypothetical protein
MDQEARCLQQLARPAKQTHQYSINAVENAENKIRSPQV